MKFIRLGFLGLAAIVMVHLMKPTGPDFLMGLYVGMPFLLLCTLLHGSEVMIQKCSAKKGKRS